MGKIAKLNGYNVLMLVREAGILMLKNEIRINSAGNNFNVRGNISGHIPAQMVYIFSYCIDSAIIGLVIRRKPPHPP